MKKMMILYPHGLGDCILLTPAIREYKKQTGNHISVVTLERFRSAKFFDNNQYVDKIYYCKDAWHDFENSQIGFQSLSKKWKLFAVKNGYNFMCMPMHSINENKILLNSKYLNIDLENTITEIYTKEKDSIQAENIIKDIVGDNDFGFIQTNTGVPSKDLPVGFGRKWLGKNKNINHFIEIGKEIEYQQYNINVQFEIMRRAKAVCIPDSVFYHACHAINKDVDFVYFGRGKEIWERVRPLHEVNENVVYDIKKYTEIDSCLICNKPVTQSYNDLVHCSSCDFLMKRNELDRSHLKKELYNFLLSASHNSEVRRIRIEEADLNLSILEKYVKVGKIFDLGAASGFVLKAAKDRGWIVDGNEISYAAVKDAKSKYNIDIKYGFFDELKLKENEYDAVNMWNALEHTMNPDDIIKITRKILKEGGAVHIRVPEKNSKTVSKWYEPHHIVEFTRKSLNLLMEKHGFRTEFIEYAPDNGDPHHPHIDGLFIKENI